MAGDDPTGDRNLVRFEPNERVDLPDMKALQDNSRSESRLLVHNFLFGHGGMGTPNAIDGTATGWVGMRSTPTGFAGPATSPQADSVTNHSKGGLCNYIKVSTVGAIVTVNVKYFPELFPLDDGGPQTGGYAGVALDDATIEQGFAAGCEGDDSQTLDMSGRIAGDYAVYFGGVADAGSPQTRLFWNANTNTENAQAMDTRKIVGWNARCELLSAGPPNDSYQAVYLFSWDGASITAEQVWQNNLFEGLVGATVPYLSSSGWGEDGSDGSSLYGYRSDDRATNGIACWQDWAALIRAQLRDIIGDSGGLGLYGHWTKLPEFTGAGGSGAWIGERSSLTHAFHHIEDDSNPHGSTLYQTNLTGTNNLDWTTATGDIDLEANGFTMKGSNIGSTSGVRVDSNLRVANPYNLVLGQGTNIVNYNGFAGETIDDGKLIYSTFGFDSFFSGNDTTGAPGTNFHETLDLNVVYGTGVRQGPSCVLFADPLATNNSRLIMSLNDKVSVAEGSGASAMRIEKILFYFYSNPAWAAGTLNTAARVFLKSRQHGVAGVIAWDTIAAQNLSQGNGGTVGDINVPPSSVDAPFIYEMDVTGEPTADVTVGGGFFGKEFCIQVQLRGDGGSAYSPFFLGCLVQWRLGALC